MHPAPRRTWDLFCRVIDNFGDVGVCWRLAADLARRDQQVRLYIDDASALAWMAPGGQAGVQVLPFDSASDTAPAQVVVEAFGCDPPAAYVHAMVQATAVAPPAPVWLNLEYLSAEDYVERSHGLPSPQRNGLTKWFFYPGFTPQTGGLLREPGLAARRTAFERTAWLQAQGVKLQAGERVVSLFCYADPAPGALQAVLGALAATPTRLLLTPTAQALLQQHVEPQVDALPSTLRLHALPWLSQSDYDHLLWASDLNFVRGEDSLVRAHWAGQPFVWHIYPQHDGVHGLKLQALLQRMQSAPEVVALWRAWNTLPDAEVPPDAALAQLLSPKGLADWGRSLSTWQAHLLAQDDLCTQLLHWVSDQLKA
jgi:uncharacterized repeat protein (TIGR03837 family)